MAKSSKSTKVPFMRDDLLYCDWKKEMTIWEKTNIIRGVDKSVLAGELFESLQGKARATVLSELEIDSILCDDGVKNICDKLDEFFDGNQVQNAFQAHDELLKFRRSPNMNLEEFLVEFQIKNNKVKASGTALSDGVLAYALLDCANLSEKRTELVKATCDVFNFKTVKKQLEKIGVGKTSSSAKTDVTKFSAPGPSSSVVKVEETMYGEPATTYSSDSSEDEHCDALFAKNNYYNRPKYQQPVQSEKHPLNPVDKYGHIQCCSFCHCIYHRLLDCPYASDEIKNNYSNKRFGQRSRNTNSYGSNTRKPL